VSIGNDCTIYSPKNTTIDVQYPSLISIGDNVKIAQGVIILTHDFSWSVIKRKTGAIFGACGKVEIGNNVFIGMNSVILRNVKIGDNVIIGAGSIVSKDLQSNGVYAGNPARFIMSVDDFIKKREGRQLEEAVCLAKAYYERFNKKPNPEIFHEFFMLFSNEEQVKSNKCFSNKMDLCGNRDDSFEYIKKNNIQKFKSFDDFWDYCLTCF
jgi:serine acetyltransferase